MHYLNILFWVFFYKILSHIIPKDEHSIVFGSWKGELYADNSRYLAEYIDKHYPEYKLYWVGNKTVEKEIAKYDQNIHFLEKGKFLTSLKVMRCKYCFVSQKYHIDISKYSLSDGATICYLHHGTPIKKWGDDGLNKKHSETRFDKTYDLITSKVVNYDYYASSSPLNSEVLCTAMKSCGCNKDKIIPSGTPRNDMLVKYDPQKALEYKSLYSAYLGITGSPVVIMYLPTYRRLDNGTFTFSQLTEDQYAAINELLKKHNAILIEKSHFVGKESGERQNSDRIFFADKGVNVQEMLMFTDVLISDYSGAFLDFSLLDRPIVHFVYDYEFYRDQDSGLYYDISDFNAGAIAKDFNELCLTLSDALDGKDGYTDRRRYVRNKYMEYEKGNASQNLFETIIKR